MLSFAGAAGVGLTLGWIAAFFRGKAGKKSALVAGIVAVASVSLTFIFLGQFHAAITGACWILSYLLHNGWQHVLATRIGGRDV